jgi:Arc/MetJ-type ribon-helix-helix transcriptional regulator
VAKAISVRLDDDALRALRQLEASGLKRSDAIRKALVESAEHLRRAESVRAEAEALEADEMDRKEMLEVAALMENLRGPG